MSYRAFAHSKDANHELIPDVMRDVFGGTTIKVNGKPTSPAHYQAVYKGFSIIALDRHLMSMAEDWGVWVGRDTYLPIEIKLPTKRNDLTAIERVYSSVVNLHIVTSAEEFIALVDETIKAML